MFRKSPILLAFSFGIRRKAWQKLPALEKYVNMADINFEMTGSENGGS